MLVKEKNDEKQTKISNKEFLQIDKKSVLECHSCEFQTLKFLLTTVKNPLTLKRINNYINDILVKMVPPNAACESIYSLCQTRTKESYKIGLMAQHRGFVYRSEETLFESK
jgi:hypothetical protein